MTETIAPTTEFGCPGCGSLLSLAQPGSTRCPRCGWKGEVYTFSPKAVEVSAAETALPDEATCIHHPSKKATAVCAGTGDYICSLCAIEVDGQTYSAQYIDSGGKKTVASAFAKPFPGPIAGSTSICSCCWFLISTRSRCWARFYGSRIRSYCMPGPWHGRREEPIFVRLMGTTSVVLLPIVLVLVGIAWLFGVVALVVFLATKGRAFR